MALTKVTYVDNETPIGADNLNAIQDAIIGLENASGGGGPIQKSALADDVQASLGKADTAVQPVTGKMLSDQNYTITEKNKLAGIEAGAQVNTITGVKGDAESSFRTGNVILSKSNIGLGNVANKSPAEIIDMITAQDIEALGFTPGGGSEGGTSYTTMTELEANTGTSTTPRVITAAVLAAAITNKTQNLDTTRIYDSNIGKTQAEINALLANNNLIDPETCVDNAYILYTNGTLRENNSSYFCTGFIPVTAGESYRANHGRHPVWFDTNKTYISGTNDVITNTEITAPANAAYLRFSVNKTTDGITTPDDLYFAKAANYYDPKTAIEEAIKSVTAYQVRGVQFPGNLIDPETCVDNAYVLYTKGTLRENNPNYFCTGFIPVTAGESYRANHGRQAVWFDANETYLSGTNAVIANVEITAPANAAYLRFSVNKTTDGITTPLDLYFAKASEFAGEVKIFGVDLTPKPWCYGKTINWIGDSIVDGQDFDEEVCAALGLSKLTTDGVDGGINGSTIALNGDGTDTRHALCARFSDMPADADIIAVSCGSNDFQYAWCPIGTIESTENTTFYGALKTLCAGLIARYPNKVIFFTTPIKRAQTFEDGNGGEFTQDGVMTTPYSKNKFGKTLGDYADIIKEVCGYYSIPVLDMYREALLNPHITEQQSLFDSAYTHPNTTGQKIMARRVAGWMTQLCYPISGLS